jgi:hypothetical protein
MWACPSMSIRDVTKLGKVVDIVSHRLLKSLTIDMVVGQNCQNRVREKKE